MTKAEFDFIARYCDHAINTFYTIDTAMMLDFVYTVIKITKQYEDYKSFDTRMKIFLEKWHKKVDDFGKTINFVKQEWDRREAEQASKEVKK